MKEVGDYNQLWLVKIKTNLQANGFSTPLLTGQKLIVPHKIKLPPQNWLLQQIATLNTVKLEFLQNNSPLTISINIDFIFNGVLHLVLGSKKKGSRNITTVKDC